MRRIGYGIIGLLLGVIIYILLLSQLPVAAEVKSTLADFNTSMTNQEVQNDYENEDLENMEGEEGEEGEDEELALKPLLEFGSYHVSVADFKNYEEKGVVRYGKVNPMFYFRKEVVAVEVKPEDNEGKPEGSVNPENPKTPADPNAPIDDKSKDNDNVHNGLGGQEEVYHKGFNLVSKTEEVKEVSSVLASFRQYGKLPVDKKYYNITSSFGTRVDPFTQNNAFHTGIDIANIGVNKANVYSMVHGEVAETVYNPEDKLGYGNYVIIKHDGYETLYAHLDSIADIKPGDKVYSGTIIGQVGNTGRSTGPHVHLEVRKEDTALNAKIFLDEFR